MSVHIHRKHSPIQRVEIGTESRSVVVRPLPAALGVGRRDQVCVEFRTHEVNEPMHSHGYYPPLSEVREFAMALLELCNQAEGEQ